MSERERHIISIFHSAIEREPRERGPFLDGAGGDDEALRLEVEALIKSNESAASFMASPACASRSKVPDYKVPTDCS